MTSTAARGSRVRLAESVASGPLLGRWGTTASPGALIDVLARPDRALPLRSLSGEPPARALERVRERAEAERELDDPLLVAVRGDRLTRLRLELPGTASGSLLVRVEVRP